MQNIKFTDALYSISCFRICIDKVGDKVGITRLCKDNVIIVIIYIMMI